MLGVDVIVMSINMTSIFNMADVNIYECDALMANPALKSYPGDQKVCKKKNLPWLFGADRKKFPSESLFGITKFLRAEPCDAKL